MATDGTAPALRGGVVSNSGTAPALRGGVVSNSGTAPALRGGVVSKRGRGVLALVCGLLFAACNPYDASELPPLPGGNGGGGGTGGMDASTPDAGADGGTQDGATEECTPAAAEICNRIDDDCNGETDEGTDVVCEQTILFHAISECVAFGNTARCVPLDCRPGYDNCDGNPANGCEPYCDCNLCDDAGAEDAGE